MNLIKKNPYNPKDLLGYDIKNMFHELETAWDESDFCVATKNKENFKYMEELYEAFKSNNIAITFIKSEIPVFSNSFLSLVIIDKLPEEIIQNMYEVDKKAKDLIEYEKKIGITDLKEKTRSGYKNEKYFMACSPRWIDYEDEKNREKKKLGLNITSCFGLIILMMMIITDGILLKISSSGYLHQVSN
jgi:hypothetical protein